MTALAWSFPWICLEEESEEGEDEDWLDEARGAESADEDPEHDADQDQGERQPTAAARRPQRRASTEILRHLVEERKLILTDTSLKPRHKAKLLEINRKAMTIARGGHVLGTEKIVYALIGMSAAVTVVLAALTTFSDLPKEVTLSFTGTVVGGLIATVAQKIGRL